MFDEKFAQIVRYARIANIPDRVLEELHRPRYPINTIIRPNIRGSRQEMHLFVSLFCNIHSTGSDPFKGGLRYAPDVTADLMDTLAFDMTEKAALTELPFGGAKTGLRINPAEYTENELQIITEELAEELLLMGILSPDYYVPGPDLGTNAQVMYWIYNRVARLNRIAKLPNVRAIVTGKPLNHHGIPGREDATSRGLLVALKEYLRLSGRNILEPLRVAVQGFGNLGMNLVKLAAMNNDLGMSKILEIVAVADKKGAIYNSKGLDIPTLLQKSTEPGFFARGAIEAETLTNEELLELPVDILIPAAKENQITRGNGKRIKAQIIEEGGNEAITPEGQTILESNGKEILTGIGVNSGGVVGSFCEWSAARGPVSHPVDFFDLLKWTHAKIDTIMIRTIQKVVAKHEESGRTLAESAHILALTAISEGLRSKHPY